jgi:DNA-binding transcriptional ArsR family regulator
VEIKFAIRRLAALAQDTRLRVFRLLVGAGAKGLPAGEIARIIGIPNNTLSAHLAILVNAGLIDAERDGRSVVYRIDFHGTRALMAYLMEDCCQGNPDVCGPILDSVLAGCCDPHVEQGRVK